MTLGNKQTAISHSQRDTKKWRQKTQTEQILQHDMRPLNTRSHDAKSHCSSHSQSIRAAEGDIWVLSFDVNGRLRCKQWPHIEPVNTTVRKKCKKKNNLPNLRICKGQAGENGNAAGQRWQVYQLEEVCNSHAGHMSSDWLLQKEPQSTSTGGKKESSQSTSSVCSPLLDPHLWPLHPSSSSPSLLTRQLSPALALTSHKHTRTLVSVSLWGLPFILHYFLHSFA